MPKTPAATKPRASSGRSHTPSASATSASAAYWWYDWYAFADAPDRRAFDDFTPRLAAREMLRQHQGR